MNRKRRDLAAFKLATTPPCHPINGMATFRRNAGRFASDSADPQQLAAGWHVAADAALVQAKIANLIRANKCLKPKYPILENSYAHLELS